MEYYWGYAAANSPLPNIYNRSRPTPARSNSTKVAPTTRRSRIPGHRRTTSTDSVHSRTSHDIPLPAPLPLDLRPPPQPSPASPGKGAPAAARAAQQSSAVLSSPTAASFQGDPLRERVPLSLRYQDKQLPATPRLDTDTHGYPLTKTISSASNSAVSPGTNTPTGAAPPPTSASSTSSSNAARLAAAAAERKVLQHAAMLPESGAFSRINTGATFGRTESLSSASGTTLSTRTMLSSEPPSSAEGGGGGRSSSGSYSSKPFVVRNGRTYLADPSLSYPLPVDLAELHRQSLRTLLLFQLFGGPVCSPAFGTKPPTRVLEVGCGSGFWSMMCHRYYSRHGHSSISFTGIDIAPIGAPASTAALASSHLDGRPDRDMKWRFVQHDMRHTPWPFHDDEFDLVMVKDLSLATTLSQQQSLMDEYLRVLRPGGTVEIWESDHTLRMLRPHVPEHSAAHCATDDEEEHEAAASLGAYLMTANTPLSAPLNNYLVEYNGWIGKALDSRSLSPVPCTLVGPMLVQEADILGGVGSKRLAVPLSEVKWEREGVGGVVTKDGKTYIETKGKTREVETNRKTLTAGQSALRKTALLTVVQLIQSLEPLLREVSGKSQDEWDGWVGKMMNDLMKENGTSWGECLEVGAWWARKRKK